MNSVLNYIQGDLEDYGVGNTANVCGVEGLRVGRN